MELRNRLLLLALFIILICLLAFGCRKPDQEQDVTDYLKDIKSYETNVEMYIQNDKQELKYTMKQYCNSSIGYRLEIGTDRIQIFRDNKIFVKDIVNNYSYELEESFDVLYKISFIGEYIKLLYVNAGYTIYNEESYGTQYKLIETIIPGNNTNLYKAVMYVNLNGYVPEKILIYDEDGKERVNIFYTDFKPNAEVGEDLFNNIT